jgi:hypothetical protein
MGLLEQLFVGTAGAARAIKCNEVRREAIERGCEHRHTKGKCGPLPKDLYDKGSKYLCGYRAKWGYDWGCDPNFVSKPLFGKGLCEKWTRKDKKTKKTKKNTTGGRRRTVRGSRRK